MSITLLDKMLLRLFIPPMSMIIIGIIVFIVFTNQFNSLDTNSILHPLLAQIFWYSAMGSLLFISGSGFLWFLINSFRLGAWYLGKSQDICPCGGMVQYHTGRFGEYMKCLACGKNTKSR